MPTLAGDCVQVTSTHARAVCPGLGQSLPRAASCVVLLPVRPGRLSLHPTAQAPSCPTTNWHTQRWHNSNIICRALRPSSPMSSELVAAMRAARQESARHGSMFLNLDHLLLGLLATTCYTTYLLQQYLTYDGVREAIDSQVVVPVSSPLTIADVDLSPTSKQALTFAQECAHDQGSSVVGTAHLASALLQDLRSPLRHLLEEQGVDPRGVEDEVLAGWEDHPEDSAHLTSASDQVTQLRRLAATKNGGPGATGAGGPGSSWSQSQVGAQGMDEEDIYN